MPENEREVTNVINISIDTKAVIDSVNALAAIVLSQSAKINALSNKIDSLTVLVQALGTVVTNPADVAAAAVLTERLKHSSDALKAVVDANKS